MKPIFTRTPLIGRLVCLAAVLALALPLPPASGAAQLPLAEPAIDGPSGIAAAAALHPFARCDSLAWIGEGDQTDCRYGTVAPAGDVNGDGYDDVLVGSYNYDHPEVDEGMAFIHFGSPGGISPLPDWTAETDQAGAHMADKLWTAGDVNGDHYDDIILGAGDYDTALHTDAGRAYLFLGSPSGPQSTPAWTFDGDQADGHFASCVSTAGDVNGDGFDDVIIGAWLYDDGQEDEGKAWLFFGSDSGLAATPDWTGQNDSPGAVYGYRATSAGDLNLEGFDDIVVGARRYSGDGLSREGRAYVYYGGPDGPSLAPDWTFDGEQTGAEVGSSVAAAGDVNGDGYDDLVISAFRYNAPDSDEGKVFLFYGGPEGLASTPDWTAEGDQAGAYFGYFAGSAGDMNGDGYDDLLIGAGLWDADSLVDAGRVDLYLGGPDGLPPAPAWSEEGDQANGRFGLAGARAGDVEGDSLDDFLVGEMYRDNAFVDAGRASLFAGCADWASDAPEPPSGGGGANHGAGVTLSLLGPNPSRGPVEIAYTLPAAGHVSLTVEDVAGRTVATLARAGVESGRHRARWDGSRRSGSSAAAGVYFIRLETPRGARSARLVRIP